MKPVAERLRFPNLPSVGMLRAFARGAGAVTGARSVSIRCLLVAACVVCMAPDAALAQIWQSDIVYGGEDGRLVYVSDDEGNRIPDFSHAGYRGGGVPIPDLDVVRSLSPVEGDNTDHIQQAIDEVAEREPDANGFRGALLLEPGVYNVTQPLRIRAGGVVLRGAGNGSDAGENTILFRTGTSTAPVIEVGSGDTNAWREVRDTRTNITSDFVPVGARRFSVDDATAFAEGDQVVIVHPLSNDWIDAVDGGGTFGSAPWRPGQFSIVFTRRIRSVQEDAITIDAPVFNHLDRRLTQSYLFRRDRSGVIEEVGVESLRIEIDTAGETAEDHAADGIRLMNVENAWVRDVTALHFVFAGVRVSRSVHVTVRDSEALEPHSLITGARRYNFVVERSQLVLFENNLATEGRHSYVGNGTGYDNGIVFLRNVSRDAHAPSEAHRQWGQGFLYDNHVEENSPMLSRRIHLGNRGNYGTSHGWASAHSVVWNCRMGGSMVVVEKPPTAQNYAIGCSDYVSGTAGPFDVPAGYIEGTGRDGLMPQSLYERQLADRLQPTSSERPPEHAATGSPYNFPDPFEDQTTLVFPVTSGSRHTATLYDILGREVRVLLDSWLTPGEARVHVDASGLAAGIYVYRIRANVSASVPQVGTLSILGSR